MGFHILETYYVKQIHLFSSEWQGFDAKCFFQNLYLKTRIPQLSKCLSPKPSLV